jgi:hypothetical protein
LIRKQKPLFLYRIQQNSKQLVAIFIKESLVQQIAIKAHFLRISGYDIADRRQKETITDEEIRTNYITLPHFVTLKDEIMRTLQNKRPINPNKKIMLKNIKNSGATKVLTVVVLSLGKESTQREYKIAFAENAIVDEHAEAVKVATAAKKKSILVLYVLR